MKKVIVSCLTLYASTVYSLSLIPIDSSIMIGFRDCTIGLTFNSERGTIDKLQGNETKKVNVRIIDDYARIHIRSSLMGIPVSELMMPVSNKRSYHQYEALLEMNTKEVISRLEKKWNISFVYVGDDGMDGTQRETYSVIGEKSVILVRPVSNNRQTLISCNAR
jgi:hypothetical protein